MKNLNEMDQILDEFLVNNSEFDNASLNLEESSSNEGSHDFFGSDLEDYYLRCDYEKNLENIAKKELFDKINLTFLKVIKDVLPDEEYNYIINSLEQSNLLDDEKFTNIFINERILEQCSSKKMYITAINWLKENYK